MALLATEHEEQVEQVDCGDAVHAATKNWFKKDERGSVMLKPTLAVSIGVLAVAVFTTAAIGPAAMAEAAKFKRKPGLGGIKTNQESFKSTEDNYTVGRQPKRLGQKRK